MMSESPATIVAVPEGVKADDVLDELCRLSLLEWDEPAERFSLHETVLRSTSPVMAAYLREAAFA